MGNYKKNRKKHIDPNCQCASCKSKRGESSGENHPNFGKQAFSFIDGRTLKKYYCNCGEEISYQSAIYGSGKCPSCARKGKKKPKLSKKMKGHIVSKKTREKITIALKRWHKNHDNPFKNKHHSKKTKSKMSERRKGKKLSKETKNKMKKTSLKKWENQNFREQKIKSLAKGRLVKPNKPEKLLRNVLNKLFPKEYKFVGDGKIFLGEFNPDFINCNGQKKIIEMYGDYWHNRKEVKIRDKKRVKVYKKYGYETLIIWEHELKNLEKVKEKILEF